MEKPFGPGHTIGFLLCFGAAVAAFVSLIFAFGKGKIAETRALGLFVAAFGAMFLFGITYTVVTDRGIPWTVNLFGRFRSGTLNRRENPVGYWSFVVLTLLLFVAVFVVGMWIRLNPEAALELAS